MKQRIKLLISSTLIVFAMTLGVVAPLTVSTADAAVDPKSAAKKGLTDAGGGGANANQLGDMIQTVVNVLLYILGAIAVIMIVLGGIRYTISNGDSSQIKGAKDTILYAVIGLVVALLAYAIVNFVLDAF